MLNAQVFFGVALLITCCGPAIAQEFSADASARDRRSIDVGWLLRNLLLNSATVTANVTRAVAAAQRAPPPPATTRRPMSTRPPTTQPPPPPPPPPLALNALLNLFASSSDFLRAQVNMSTMANTTTMPTAAPPPPPPPPPPRQRIRPRPNWRPPFNNDYDYIYGSGLDGYVGREYDFQDASAAPSAPSAQPSSAGKSARNRQRPAPQVRRPPTTAPTAPPAPPQPQRGRLLYQYAQRDDTSFNDNNDDTQPQGDENIVGQDGTDGADAANGGEESGNAADGVDNEIPSFVHGAPPPEAPSFEHRPYSKPPSAPFFDSQSYYDSDSPSAHRFTSFGSGPASVESGYGGASFGFHHASPAKATYQSRDAFSDFQTTYHDSHYQPSTFGSYKYHSN